MAFDIGENQIKGIKRLLCRVLSHISAPVFALSQWDTLVIKAQTQLCGCLVQLESTRQTEKVC